MNNLNKNSRRFHSSCAVRMTGETVTRWMTLYATLIRDAEPELTELDRAIGDGDHGVNMRRGMDAVVARLDELDSLDLPGKLRAISTILISSIGGASGPLYGTFFLQSSHSSQLKPDLGLVDLTAAVEAGCRGVVQLGKAAVGDKTMVDSLTATVTSLRRSYLHQETLPEALEECRLAARRAAKATIPMVARKGRASYLGERSAGTQDPGATSATLLFDALAQAVSALPSSALHKSSNPPEPVLL